MALTDFNAEEEVKLNPSQTRCTCKRSVVLPAHPRVHCPRCHHSYRARGLGYPVYCPACGFNLKAWRQRNGIEELQPPLP